MYAFSYTLLHRKQFGGEFNGYNPVSMSLFEKKNRQQWCCSIAWEASLHPVGTNSTYHLPLIMAERRHGGRSDSNLRLIRSQKQSPGSYCICGKYSSTFKFVDSCSTLFLCFLSEKTSKKSNYTTMYNNCWMMKWKCCTFMVFWCSKMLTCSPSKLGFEKQTLLLMFGQITEIRRVAIFCRRVHHE